MVILVLIFCVGVIVWFFIYAKPTPTPSLGDTSNPLLVKDTPIRHQFINKDGDDPLPPTSTSTTEITPFIPQPLSNIWKDPTTGQTFVTENRLVEVESKEIIGTTTVTSKRFVQATGTILMFVDRNTGHISGHSEESHKTYQISNTTLPGIYDAYIFNNGKSVIMRYEDLDTKSIVATLATIPTVREDSQAKPLEKISNLPSQVTSVAVNKKATSLSYLVSNDTGSSVYTIEGDKKAMLVTSSPLKELTLSYGGKNLYATIKPSAYVKGQTVLLPTFEYILGDKTGLMSLPGENGALLNSMWSSSGLKTFLSNKNTLKVLTISTLASKCVWVNPPFIFCAVSKTIPKGPEGLPDDWFQGRVSFNDYIMILNSNSSTSTPLFYFNSVSNLPFDVVGLTVSTDNSLIGFVRKQDGGLWLLDTTLIKEE